jgi:hypothetical protein
MWSGLLENPVDPEWQRHWQLIQAAGDGGDAGILDQVQALAKTPAAAVALVLRVPKDALVQALALDMAAPIFWPAVPVEAFARAFKCDYDRNVRRYSAVLENAQETAHAAITALARRINNILKLRPELAGHFMEAFMRTSMFAPLMHVENCNELLGRLLVADSGRLARYAQEAAHRFYWLPAGLRGQEPRWRPAGLDFNAYLQPVIDAPLVTAEIAAGRRVPDTSLILSLINLRLVDPAYFDDALPAALALVLAQARR